MSEEKVADDQTPETPEVEEKPTISETELETLKANSAKYEQLEADAKALGFNSYEEYLGLLEQNKYNEVKDEGKTVEVKQDTKKVDTPKVETPVVQTPPAPDPLIIQSYLEAQYATYLQLQAQLPEEDRGKYSKQELLTVIQGPKTGVIQSLMADPELDGNAFMAAKYLLNIPKTKKQAQQQATDTADALSDAKETAKVSTEAPPPDKKTEKTANEIEADKIALDTPYVYPE